MLKILINPKNLPEKEYILNVLFNDFLGIDYQIELNIDKNDYIIVLPNQKKIIIKDFFWLHLSNDLEYLDEKYLPTKPKFLKSQFCIDKDLPLLFGNPNIIENPTEIILEADIFSSAFFFLTRWEEYVEKERDKYGRFKVEHSFSMKHNLVHRPVVDEYVEFLWNIIHKVDPSLKRKLRKYKPIITHDIDFPLRLMNLRSFRNSFFRNLLKRKNYSNALRDIFVYFYNKVDPTLDLGFSYDFLMDTSESIGVKSNFFFINSKKTKFDPGYNNNHKLLQEIFSKIKQRNHIIGIHPSFYSSEDPVIWKDEYIRLCEYTQVEIKNGRQHYLRFEVPYTWQIWEDNRLEFDHTLGFAELEGFRCGTCFNYPVYNFLTRQKLNLRESPLIFMDVSITEYQKVDKPDQYLNKLRNIVETVKKFNGEFVYLYHNSFFDTKYMTRELYKTCLQIIK